METKASSNDRLDGLDAERFREMLASPPFETLKRRVLAELERARNDAERKADPLDIYRAQGAASAFRVFLALPELILKEIEKPK